MSSLFTFRETKATEDEEGKSFQRSLHERTAQGLLCAILLFRLPLCMIPFLAFLPVFFWCANSHHKIGAGM